MQRRLVSKLELETVLSEVKPHPSPRPKLEQYTIPTDVAATVLRTAAYAHDNILGKEVIDLGCGTGRLAIGAAYLGATQVVGVDIDKIALKKALINSRRSHVEDKTQWIASDIDTICGRFDTVLQNPPFGVQKRSADLAFLEKALRIGNVIYSLHKIPLREARLLRLTANCTVIKQIPPTEFLKRFVEERKGRIKTVLAMTLTIPHQFSFHQRSKHMVAVGLYVIETHARLRKMDIPNSSSLPLKQRRRDISNQHNL